MDKMQVKITGKNSDGEYWLHLVGGGQNAGFNLGDPETMVGAALLKAASGQRFVSAENPPCAPADPVRDALIDALEELNAACDAMWNDHERLEPNPDFFGQKWRLKEKHIRAISKAQQKLPAAIAKAEGAA